MVDDYYHNYRREVFEIVPKGASRILEIGCAAGCFRLNFGDGVECWGVEPVEDAYIASLCYRLKKRIGLIKSHVCFHACWPLYAKEFGLLHREIEKYEKSRLEEMAKRNRDLLDE